MISIAKAASVPVIVDPKGTDYSKYRGATLITPNMKEFEAVAGECISEDDFVAKARSLREELELEYLLVTRSEKGMSLFCADGRQVNSPATALEVYDVSGAGDTVISMMALTAVSDFSNQDKLTLANTVAGIVVGKVGTAVATIDEVIAKLHGSRADQLGCLRFFVLSFIYNESNRQVLYDYCDRWGRFYWLKFS